MGCAQSRIENEEAVARCKERRQMMKSAVSARNAFAAAHSAYAVSLKETGSALSQFALGESDPLPPSSSRPSTSASAAEIAGGGAGGVSVTNAVRAPIDNLPPPPPPLPEFSPSPAKIQRSISLPDQIQPAQYPPKPVLQHSASIQEEAEEDEEMEEEETEIVHLDDRRRRRHQQIHLHRAQKAPPATQTGGVKPPPSPPPMQDSWDYFFAMDARMSETREEDEIDQIVDEEEFEEEDDKFTRSPPPPPTPPPEEPRTPPPPATADLPPLPPKPPARKGPVIHHQHANSAPALDAKLRGKGKMVPSEAPGVSLLQILADLDEHYLKASESAIEVSKMLEANRMHYHSNFADNRGHIDHSARVMKIITWNRSFKGLHNGEEGKDDLENDEWETLATVLDKMLAWEKKLYDEVKAGELMKIEYQRKVVLLNKQKKNGASLEALEKTKAAVSHLHTRYIVDMQSMDSTVAEIQQLRDGALYPRLVSLTDGLAEMWRAMYHHHETQLKIVMDHLKTTTLSNSPSETTSQHHTHTSQLCLIVQQWQTHFDQLIAHQKEFIQFLTGWLKLNLIPIESSLREKVSSPPRAERPMILGLLHTWNDNLGRLPDELAKSAIKSFLAVLNTIRELQQEEMKQREKRDETQREYEKKCRSFEDWYQKYVHKNVVGEENNGENENDGVIKDPVSERRFLVESLKSRLKDENETHSKLAKQVREKSLTSLKTHLPELFRALSDFSRACGEMHSNLRVMSRLQNSV
ncbi:hypothetical protein LUZ60_003715 [Juncus effusus]|nr:hypothetical protein LUZ60_003715 [Juncus effusus]